jgi:Tol biopolymer transport system component/uncharacterized RDD family membrane protein YckC
MSEVFKPAPQPAPQPLEPPPPVAPGQENLLGRRISAALIDVGLLLAVLVVLGLTIGEARAQGGSVSVTLGGAWAAVYLSLVLLYHLMLEATIGQTVGKRLLGLRVVRPDGGRPSIAAIALRTLLRIVDWLPLLYLVGFIAIQATGARRQRLGDLAARTTVARALPVRRGLALVAVSMVAALVVLSAWYAVASGRLTSTSGSSGSASGNATSTYRDHGVSFQYPAGWQQSSNPQARASSGGGDTLWSTAVAADTVNLVLVEAYRIRTPVTVENLDAATPGFQEMVQRLFQQLGGAAQAGPETFGTSGLPGLRFRGTGTLDGAPIQSTLVLAFDHTTEYFFNCQSTRARAAEMQRGCDQIVRTFKVATPSGASTAPAPRLGNRIVFTSNRTGTFNLYLVNADGSGLRQLTRFRTGYYLARPSLSPDGGAVVFERLEKQDASSSIWIVRTDGRGLRNLTPDPEDDTSPSWSPDGTKILFASSRSGAYDIFTMHPDGTAIEQLGDRGAVDAEPAISPDGTKIAFLECNPSFNACQLWTMHADGTAARRLTRTPVEAERPAWSPDSNRIAFTRKQHGNSDIYVIAADSRRQQRLTGGPDDEYQPTWSPDGTRIAFGSNRAGPPSLYVMQANGTRVQRLTTPSKGQDEDLSWQP